MIDLEYGGVERASERRPVLALAALALSCSVALAQNASYSIPSGQLDTGLTRLGLASGIQVLYDSAVTTSLRTRGVSGSQNPQAALGELLQGKNLSYRFTSPTSVTIADPIAASPNSSGDATVMQPIVVQTDAEVGWGRVEGFVVMRSLTATKTDTPLLETPQAISVISAD